jgi:hypothetical protein
MSGHCPVRTLALIVVPLVSPVLVSRAQPQDVVAGEDSEGTTTSGSPQEEGVERAVAGLALDISLGGGWDSNARFESGGEHSANGYGQADVGRTWTTPSWTFAADVSGGGSVYRATTATNRYQFSGGLSASGALGTRTDLSVAGSGSVEYTDFLSDPATAGLALPLTLTRRVVGNATMQRRLGARTRLDLNADYGRYFFDSEELADGSGISGGAGLSRGVSDKTSLSFAYAYQANQYEGTGWSQVNRVSAGLSRTLSEHATLSMSGGVDGRSLEGLDTRWIASGSGTLAYKSSRTTWSLRFYRGVSPGPGLGTDRILNLFSLVLSSTPRPWLTLSATASHGINQDPLDPGSKYESDDVGVFVRFRLTRTLGLAPQVSYRRRGEFGDQPEVHSMRLGLALSYSELIR